MRILGTGDTWYQGNYIMAITQQNLYIPGFNVPSIATNIDYDRLGVDKSVISVDYSVSPAVVTVKKGSIIEANGDTYLVDNDEVFAMANAAHNYITFDGTTFSSAATIGTWSTLKQGYYNGTVRTLRHYIDQAGETNLINIDFVCSDKTPASRYYAKCLVYMSGDDNTAGLHIVPFDTIDYDILGNYDTVSRKFTANKSGYYLINMHVVSVGMNMTISIYLYKNGINTLDSFNLSMYGGITKHSITILYLNQGDYIQIYTLLVMPYPYSALAGWANNQTYLLIAGLL